MPRCRRSFANRLPPPHAPRAINRPAAVQLFGNSLLNRTGNFYPANREFEPAMVRSDFWMMFLKGQVSDDAARGEGFGLTSIDLRAGVCKLVEASVYYCFLV